MNIASLQPQPVWERFAAICAVPHPSHHEEALGRAVVAWAKERGLETKVDAVGNVALRRPGRAASGAGIILQAHLDMVPQKAASSSHDFLKDPIRPRLDPSDPAWVIADGTTLGADNGIGVAMAQALITDPELASVPIECLFTVNEEDGMSGAKGVEPGFVSGSVLLNLDGEDAEELTIGCAGAIRMTAVLSREAEACPAGLAWFAASVGGLLGGHSGVDIDKGRDNATLALVSLLERTRAPLYLASLEGGTAANAIPRDASALVGVKENDAAAFRTAFKAASDARRLALGAKDPGLEATLSPAKERPARTLGPDGASSLLAVLGALPNGLQAMEPDMPGLIRTSLNLGTLKACASGDSLNAELTVMIRSSSDDEKASLADIVEQRINGASDHGWSISLSRPSGSPAWSPNNASPLLAKSKEVYKELFGKYPTVTSTHGGLETGLFRPRFPGWDMLSLGPTIRYPHSPDERLEVAAVERSYRFVKRLLKSLA